MPPGLVHEDTEPINRIIRTIRSGVIGYENLIKPHIAEAIEKARAKGTERTKGREERGSAI